MRVRPAAILGWTVLLSVLAWAGLAVLAPKLWPQRAPFVPGDAVWLASNREAAQDLHAGLASMFIAPPVFEHCVAGAPDEVQLHRFDAWMADASGLVIVADGDAGARAHWRPIREEPVPGNATARRVVFGDSERHVLAKPVWDALREALRAPAFADLPPQDASDCLDCRLVVIETCLAGAHHIVIRTDADTGAPGVEAMAARIESAARSVPAVAGDETAAPKAAARE